jgi:Putative restriction endonuclease
MREPVPGPTSIREFEGLLAASEQKLELLEGQVVAFAGGSVAHGMLVSRLHKAVANATQPPCNAFTSDVAVRVDDRGTYVFPDVSRTCEKLDAGATYIVAPDLVIEVISPDSKDRDRSEKLDAYQSLSSVMGVHAGRFAPRMDLCLPANGRRCLDRDHLRPRRKRRAADGRRDDRRCRALRRNRPSAERIAGSICG